jgi:hypothetical protein
MGNCSMCFPAGPGPFPGKTTVTITNTGPLLVLVTLDNVIDETG